MSHLVGFDPHGVCGPAMTLIFNFEFYNEQGIDILTKLLKKNFTNLAHTTPQGRKEFCHIAKLRNEMQMPFTRLEIVATRFFQSMQNTAFSPTLHQQVLETIVPHIMKLARECFPQAMIEDTEFTAVNVWTARLVECYMSQEQILQFNALPDRLNHQIMEERKEIAGELQTAITSGQFTENDMDRLSQITSIALSQLKDRPPDHLAVTLNFIGKYLILFAKTETPMEFGDDVLDKLPLFRQKMFPKKV